MRPTASQGVPRISVVLPVWNGAKYLHEAMASILGQTFADLELIVVDDGSTDATPEVIARVQDPRLRAFRREHSGLVATLNFGVEQARAKWIARQDADDLSAPERLAAQWEAVCQNKKAVMCYAGMTVIGCAPPPPRRKYINQSRGLVAVKLCTRNPFAHGTVLFQKSAYEAAGRYRADEFLAEDYGLWGRMLPLGEFVGLAGALYQYRIHEGSVTRSSTERQEELARQLRLEHCRRYLQLAAEEADRACAVLAAGPGRRRSADWFWFVGHCLPRVPWPGVDLWVWAARQTFQLAKRRDPANA
jgi:glycosyltransferase involved in cell wall biosynthesis